MLLKFKMIVYVSLLLVTAFLPEKEAWAGISSYLNDLSKKVTAATSSITSSSTYKYCISPITNQIPSVSSVNAFVKNEVRANLISAKGAIASPLLSLNNIAGKNTGSVLSFIQNSKASLKAINLPSPLDLLGRPAKASPNISIDGIGIYRDACFIPYRHNRNGNGTINRQPASGISIASIDHSVEGAKVNGDLMGPYLNNGTRLNDLSIYNPKYDTINYPSKEGRSSCFYGNENKSRGVETFVDEYDSIASNPYRLPIVNMNNTVIAALKNTSFINNNNSAAINFSNNVNRTINMSVNNSEIQVPKLLTQGIANSAVGNNSTVGYSPKNKDYRKDNVTINRQLASGTSVAPIGHSVRDVKVWGDVISPYLNNGTRLNGSSVYNPKLDNVEFAK